MAPDRAELDAILDRPDPAEATPEPTPAADPDPTPEPAADTTPAAEPDADDPWDAGADTFDRPYVESLRKENQRRRQRSKRYDEVFDGYTDDERDFLLNLASEVRSNPAQAAQRAAQLAQVLGATPAEQQQVANEVDESGPLTAKDIAQIIDQQLSARDQRHAAQQQEQEQKAAVAEVFTDAEKLGYEQDTPEFINLLYVAARDQEHDPATALQLAHKQIQAQRQQVIDDYLAQKAKESDQTPDTRTPGGSAPSGEKKIASIKAATAALRASNLGG